jgi:hypothetical protein
MCDVHKPATEPHPRSLSAFGLPHPTTLLSSHLFRITKPLRHHRTCLTFTEYPAINTRARPHNTTMSQAQEKAQQKLAESVSSVPQSTAAQQSDNVAHALAGAGGGLLSMALTYDLILHPHAPP